MTPPPNHSDEHHILFRLENNEDQIETLQRGMEELSMQLSANTKSSKEIIEMYASMKGFLRVMAMLQKLMTWLCTIAAGVAIILAAIRYGLWGHTPPR